MRIRKSTINLTQNEWDTLNQAINELVSSGEWHKLLMYHGDMSKNHRMHGSVSGAVGYARFLYWHRAYIIECENVLRKIDDSITIPYWDWLNTNRVPTGLKHMPIRGVMRNNGNINITNKTEINRIMGHITFDDFVKDLEVNPHNTGHNLVGGIMLDPMRSPTDPLFYMHHANVDRIWSEWQAKQGNSNKKPSKPNNSGNNWEILDPWEWSIDDMHDIENLNDNSYKYI